MLDDIAGAFATIAIFEMLGNKCVAAIVAVALLIGLPIAGIRYMITHKTVKTEEIAQTKANEVLSTKEEGKVAKDAWGNPLQIVYSESAELRQATVTSGGKDEKFGTEDDIVKVATDLNKSRLVGQWVGKKSVEFSKGVASGIKGAFSDE